MLAARSPANCPALVLNADFRPLSYFPLSLWSWQDAIKAVCLDRINILEQYDRSVRSPSFEIKLPSVVSLKTYVKPARNPAFTRFNVFLRDRFQCQYCGAWRDRSGTQKHHRTIPRRRDRSSRNRDHPRFRTSFRPQPSHRRDQNRLPPGDCAVDANLTFRFLLTGKPSSC